MQELTSAPQMASPYTPAGGTNMPILAAQQPKLGTPIPGTTGGLAAKPGLTVYDNPLSQELQSQPNNPQQSNPAQAAQQTQSYGRGQDSVLVHMTPEEVNSLRGLAQQFGGDLTVNPHTGMPEAGWLGKLLPTILGFAGAAFGLPTWALALGGAAGGTAITGDLRQGLMAGLGAWGGASLAGGLGLGKAGEAALKAAEVGTDAATQLGTSAASNATNAAINASTYGMAAAQGAMPAAASAATNAATQGGGFLSNFSNAAKAGMPSGVLSKAAPYAAGMGLLNTASELSQPNLPKYTPEKETPYVPMGPGKREVMYQTPEQMRKSGSSEFTYFTPSNPAPVPLGAKPMSLDEEDNTYSYADGGTVTPPAGFQDLVSYFGANNPGAITASMYPTSAAPTAPAAPAPTAGAGEKVYNFGKTPASTTPTPSAGTNYQYVDIPGFGSIQVPNYDFSGADWSSFAQQYGYVPQSQANDLSPINDRINELQNTISQQPTFDPYSFDWASVMPEYQAPDLSGIQSQLGELKQAQQAQPTFDPYAFDWSSVMPQYEAPDLSGFQSQLSEIQRNQQTQPTFDPYSFDWSSVMPKYESPDLSGIYGRLDQLQQAIPAEPPSQQNYYNTYYDQQAFDPYSFDWASVMPKYEAPDLSGIQSQLSELQRTQQQPQQQQAFDPYSFDWASVMPKYEAPDLSGIYGRLDQLQQAINSTPSYDGGQYSQPYQPAAPSYDESQYFQPFDEQGYSAFDDLTQFARGGSVDMRDGSFVVDARTVSELGNGSSNAGKEILARLGGKPLNGPGDGVSDSIPARIGGKQEARVARDEVIMPPEAVKRMGGTKKLYAMMDKAHKARKKAKRGQDTKLAKGLGAL